MSNETQGSESWNVTGKAEKNIFEGNKAPIIQNPSAPVTINYGLEGKTSLEARSESFCTTATPRGKIDW